MQLLRTRTAAEPVSAIEIVRDDLDCEDGPREKSCVTNNEARFNLS
jgi:hypothetical protein